jgi:hypothetical protein
MQRWLATRVLAGAVRYSAGRVVVVVVVVMM